LANLSVDISTKSSYTIAQKETKTGFPKERRMKMKSVKISLNSIDAVKSFVNTVSKYESDFDLVSGRYVIDAKSIMGIFSLDLSKPIELNIHSEDQFDEIIESLKPYIVA
jgi:phosphotransferase system HPr-like phosphotransfer protein